MLADRRRSLLQARYKIIVAALMSTLLIAPAVARADNWTDSFVTQKCPLFVPSGSNGYFNINPGHKTVLAGIEGKSGDHLRLTITVTPQVKMLGGVLTKLVEERAIDTQTGALKEIALNYFAICVDVPNKSY